MGKFSTYRYLELKDDTPASHISVSSRSRPLKQPRRLRKIFIFLILLALCVTYFLGLFAGQTQWFDGLAKSLGYESAFHHAVVVDAGSSGTRVLAYKFRVPFTVFGQASLDLVDEYFEETKPGLSSYVAQPDEGAASVVRLVRRAEARLPLPPAERRRTPLLVRATAGLRLLPAGAARALVDSVARAVAGLGYDADDGAVEIMRGSDEGIFIWYTVNLLHGLLGGETVAALDLGGGSTQITFRLGEGDAELYPRADQFVVSAGGNATLYTHSYLGLGLLAARLGVFRLEAGGQGDEAELTSSCVEPIVRRERWTYANREYRVSGAERARGVGREEAYRRCHRLVRRYVAGALDWEPRSAPRGAVAAMSYFYDVAADAGIIDVERGGAASVAAYRASALKACSSANVEQPWACVDLVYVVTLLQDAYKMADDERVSLFKKVNGHEVSWALGLAYTTLLARAARPPPPPPPSDPAS